MHAEGREHLRLRGDMMKIRRGPGRGCGGKSDHGECECYEYWRHAAAANFAGGTDRAGCGFVFNRHSSGGHRSRR